MSSKKSKKNESNENYSINQTERWRAKSFKASDAFFEELSEMAGITGFSESEIIRASVDFWIRCTRENKAKIISHHKISEAIRLNPSALKDYQTKISELNLIARDEAKKKTSE